MTARLPAPAPFTRFGKLKVFIPDGQRRDPRTGKSRRAALCWCDCGGPLVAVLIKELYNGNCKSCGCGAPGGRNRLRPVRHGLSHTVEYDCWSEARRRTILPTHDKYPDWGGRGIYMCEEWLNSFEQFYADMGPRPSPQHSLDRLDNDGPYAPWNCEWRTKREQGNNRRDNVLVIYRGELLTIAEAARLAGIAPSTAVGRRRAGWPESEWFVPLRRVNTR